jgi:hypothetical protein
MLSPRRPHSERVGSHPAPQQVAIPRLLPEAEQPPSFSRIAQSADHDAVTPPRLCGEPACSLNIAVACPSGAVVWRARLFAEHSCGLPLRRVVWRARLFSEHCCGLPPPPVVRRARTLLERSRGLTSRRAPALHGIGFDATAVPGTSCHTGAPSLDHQRPATSDAVTRQTGPAGAPSTACNQRRRDEAEGPCCAAPLPSTGSASTLLPSPALLDTRALHQRPATRDAATRQMCPAALPSPLPPSASCP